MNGTGSDSSVRVFRCGKRNFDETPSGKIYGELCTFYFCNNETAARWRRRRREYFFKTKDEFEKIIAKAELIEYAKYVENYYGTPKAYVEKQLHAGKDVILEIEIQGALKVKEAFPDTLLLFVVPPSAAELRKRLIGRGTESMEVIGSRMRRAAEEAEGMEAYDYLVVNDDLDTCVEQMHRIICAEHLRTRRNEAFIGKMKEELKGLKGE